MELLQLKVAGLPIAEWATACAIALAAGLALRIAKGIILRTVHRVASKTSHWADDVVSDVLHATQWYLYIVVAVYAAGAYLTPGASVRGVLNATISVALIVQGGVWLQALSRSFVGHWTLQRNSKHDSTVAAGVQFVAKLLIWTAVALLVLANLGVEITAVIAGLGVGGVAVALAVQGILADLFASLSMYFDRPFDIGDFIIVDDYMGAVEKIGLRTTRVASLGGEQIVFANGDLVKARVRNYARMRERRVVFAFGIEYGLPAEKVERAAVIAREVISETPETRLDRVHFAAYGAYSLDYEAVYYVLSPDYGLYMDCQHSINMAIYRRFEAEGIPFAFPTRTLHLKGDPELIGAGRAGRSAPLRGRRDGLGPPTDPAE